MELFDLYTADRTKTGQTMVRGESTPDGFFRLVVHICIFDEAGRMLIQQRQPFKKGWSNLWDISVGGCAKAGDTSQAAAERETLEELGLSIDLSNDRPTMTINFEHGFDDYYVVTMPVDTQSLSLQPEEVQAVKWASKDEIMKMIDDGEFIPYEKSLIELLFYRKDHRSSHTKADITRAVPQRVLDMRKAWADADARRDEGLTEPDDIVKFRNISYGSFNKWNLLDLYIPEDKNINANKAGCALPVIVSIHGGGFFYGDKELYRFYCMHLAQSGFAVVNYNYRLAPEFKFPAPLEDAAAVLRWISENAEKYNLDKHNIFMTGDSAGAQLVSQMGCILTNKRYSDLFKLVLPKDLRIGAVSLACGVYSFPSSQDTELISDMQRDYFGDLRLLDDEKVKVQKYITQEYPPAFVFSSYCDFLYAECEPMAKLISARGGQAEYRIFGSEDRPDIGHVFHVNMKLEEGEKANIAQIGFFREHII